MCKRECGNDHQELTGDSARQAAAFYRQIADLVAAHKQSLQEQNEFLSGVMEQTHLQYHGIATMIHDELCQRVVAAKMHMESCPSRRAKSSDAVDECSIALKHLDEVIVEARRLIRKLKPRPKRKKQQPSRSP